MCTAAPRRCLLLSSNKSTVEVPMRYPKQLLFNFVMLLAISSISLGAFAQGHGKHGKDSDKDDDERKGQGQTSIMWINHLDLVAGDPSVVTSFNAINSGVGGGLSGLIIMSTTTGDTANGGGNK